MAGAAQLALVDRLEVYQLFSVLLMRPINEVTAQWLESEEAAALLMRLGIDPASLALNRDRTYLFRALAPGVGAQPPYESYWTAKAEPGSVIVALRERYRAAGVEVDASAHDRSDYLGVEVAFMAALAEQEFQAVQAGDEIAAARLSSLRQAFLADHLGAWAPAYLTSARRMAKTRFYGEVLDALNAFLSKDLA